MKNVLEYFRVKEWYASKIPLAMAIFLHYVLFMELNLTKQEILLNYAAFFVFFVAYFAFNYLINDFFDMEADRLAGKKKVILSVPAPVVAGTMLVLFLVGNLTMWVIQGFKTSVIVMSLVLYLLGASYSVKGLRMKERGIWGLIVSSFAQRNSPILLLATIVPMATDNKTFWCWMVISFVNGLRYILIHQYIDQENDRKSNIHTFVAERMKSISIAIWISMGIEIASLCVLYWELKDQVIVWILAFVYAFLLYLNGVFVTKVLHQSFLYSFANVPLEDLYNVYLPLILTICYVMKSELYVLGIVTLLYLWIPLKKKLEMPVAVIKMKLDKSL